MSEVLVTKMGANAPFFVTVSSSQWTVVSRQSEGKKFRLESRDKIIKHKE